METLVEVWAKAVYPAYVLRLGATTYRALQKNHGERFSIICSRTPRKPPDIYTVKGCSLAREVDTSVCDCGMIPIPPLGKAVNLSVGVARDRQHRFAAYMRVLRWARRKKTLRDCFARCFVPYPLLLWRNAK